MKVFKKLVQVEEKEYFKKHLEIIGSVAPLNLTEKEIEVLAEFMAAPSTLIEDDMFNTLVRKLVMRNMNLSSGGLGNYLKTMTKKSVLLKSKIGRITINPSIIPADDNQMYQFKIMKYEPNK